MSQLSGGSGTRVAAWRRRATVAAAALLVASPGAAHHSFVVEYDVARPVTLHGVVARVEWANPHAQILVDVADASGTSTTWTVQLASPNVLARRGWTVRTLRVGSRVRLEGYGGVAIATRAVAERITTEDGRVLRPGAEPAIRTGEAAGPGR
jgi:hypothetical protein